MNANMTRTEIANTKGNAQRAYQRLVGDFVFGAL